MNFRKAVFFLAAALAVVLLMSACNRKGDLFVYVNGVSPDGGLEKAQITITSIEMLLKADLKKNASATDQWIIVSTEPITFDLRNFTSEKELIWIAVVPEGRYEQVNLMIGAAQAVRNGIPEPIRGNKKMMLPAAFTVLKGRPNNITLTLDVKQAFNLSG